LSLYGLARPLLFSLDPETAHGLALRFAGLFPVQAAVASPVKAMGLDFPNPIGLAAGLDKDAAHADALARMGFGFLELGGVTPRPQPGNPRPRLFRLPRAEAVINRYGLNSAGVDVFVQNLKEKKGKTIVGVNIGKNKDTPNERAAEDYEACLEKLYPHVDYVTLNVSSPNTPGLRDLQDSAALSSLLSRVRIQREKLRQRTGRHVALAVKLSPDMSDDQLKAIAGVFRRERIDGVVATNTTLSRAGAEGLPFAAEQGGLSGAPLRERATQVVRILARELGGEIPVIGVGGIHSGADALEKFDAGATLVQLYTGLIYRGPGLVGECAAAHAARSR
jgi:dihydroorotate dehydrogenase